MRFFAVVQRDDGALVGHIPACPGCIGQADPGEDIHKVMGEALTGWLESRLKHGRAPPVPGEKPTPKRGERIIEVEVPPQVAVRLQIRLARQNMEMTQAELAERAGVTQPQIARLENPDANPTLETIVKVAEALGKRLHIELIEA